MTSSPNPSAAEGFLAKRARLRRIAARFDRLATRCYIVGKLAIDPAYAAVLRRLRDSRLPIIDIGCGLGLLAHYLRDFGCEAPIHGCDLDPRKIHGAIAAAARGQLSDVRFEVSDVARLPRHRANLVLLDVLHYLEPQHRQRLLQELASRARDGSPVLVRGAIRDGSWRYRATVAQEYWTRWSGWIPSAAGIPFPTLEEITAPFTAAGCHCEARPLWGRTPFNSYLVAVEPPAQAE